MYKSKNNSPERNSKMSEKELRKLEERRAKEDFLMSYGPVPICQFELKKIEVKFSSVECPQPPFLYDLGDPELFKVYRRPGEASKPIFVRSKPNVLVNKPPDSDPPHQSSHHHCDLSRSRHRSISRSRSSRSRTPHKSSCSHHPYRRSSPEIVAHKTSSEYKPSRSGSIHRRSPQPPESNKYDRSPKWRRSRESSERIPSRRANSSSRQTSPRRYSPNRKYSPSRSSRRPRI